MSSVSFPPIHEIWHIPSGQVNQVQNLVAPFTEDEFIEALLKEGVEVRYNEEAGDEILVEDLPDPVQGPRIDLYSKGEVTAYLPERIRAPFHIVLVLDGEKETILDVTPEQMVALHKTVQKVAAVYQSYGANDYVISFAHHLASQKNRFEVEVIGARPEFQGKLNKLDVSDRQHWIHKFPIPSPPELSIDALNHPDFRNQVAEQLRQGLKDPSIFYTPNEAPTPKAAWTQTNILEGTYKLFLLKSIFGLFKQASLALRKEVITEAKKSDEKRDVEKGAFCPFCTEKIVASESVLRNDHVALLYNPTSSHPRGHFLLITTSHKARYEDLNEVEITTAHLAIQRFVRLMHEEFDWKNWGTTVVQNGKDVNQTVPHFHYKLEHGDDPLPYALYQMIRDQGDTRKVPQEEVAAIVESLRERLECSI